MKKGKKKIDYASIEHSTIVLYQIHVINSPSNYMINFDMEKGLGFRGLKIKQGTK